MRVRYKQFFILVLFYLLVWTCLHAQSVDSWKSITANKVLNHAKYLASNQLKGRETFSEGQFLAAKYIAEEFKKYDLEPQKENGHYYQRFEFDYAEVNGPNSLKINGTVYADGKDFRVAAVGSNQFERRIAFVGYGIFADDYDSYADIDVKDKIVMVFEGKIKKKGAIWGIAPLHSVRIANAINHGADGMLFVKGTAPKDHKRPIPSRWTASQLKTIETFVQRLGLDILNEKVKQQWNQFPMIYIDVKIADQILSQTGQTILSIKSEIDRSGKPKSFQLRQQAKIRTSVFHEKREIMNVLGFIEGSDPSFRQEAVIIGAHYDHLGMSEDSIKIYYGADDNASGTAALLEVARAFSLCKAKPKRSTLFIAFTGEEIGCLGSQYYIKHPVSPLDKTVAMLNMDMIGRNDPNEIRILHAGDHDSLALITQQANQELGLKLKHLKKSYVKSSDHALFYGKGIPVITYYDGGGEFAHTPSDTWDKLSSKKMQKVARLCFLTAYNIANKAQLR